MSDQDNNKNLPTVEDLQIFKEIIDSIEDNDFEMVQTPETEGSVEVLFPEIEAVDPVEVLSFDGVIEQTDFSPDISDFLNDLVKSSKINNIVDPNRELVVSAVDSGSYFNKFKDRAQKANVVTRSNGFTPTGKYSQIEGILLDKQMQSAQDEAIANISRLSKALLKAVEAGHIVIQDSQPVKQSFWKRCQDRISKRLFSKREEI